MKKIRAGNKNTEYSDAADLIERLKTHLELTSDPQLAKELGVRPQVISQIKRGKSTKLLPVLKRWELALSLQTIVINREYLTTLKSWRKVKNV